MKLGDLVKASPQEWWDINPAANTFISKPALSALTTSSVCSPIEPVEPNIANEVIDNLYLI